MIKSNQKNINCNIKYLKIANCCSLEKSARFINATHTLIMRTVKLPAPDSVFYAQADHIKWFNLTHSNFILSNISPKCVSLLFQDKLLKR
jgi:hypothetical protein